MTTDRARSIRNIVAFALLVDGLAWLGPILGGDPTAPGLGFLVWGAAPIVSALVMKLLLRDEVSMGCRPAFRGNGRWYALSVLAYPVTITVVLGLGLLLVCVAYLMVESFWRYIDRTSGVWSELSRNSYGVYIIHVIVIGVSGTLLLKLSLPALAKCLMLIVLTYAGSNLIVSAYRSLVRTVKSSRGRRLPYAEGLR